MFYIAIVNNGHIGFHNHTITTIQLESNRLGK